MKSEVLPGIHTVPLQNFKIDTLSINSQVLKNNALGDSTWRHIPVLTPKKAGENLPVVLVLAGFTGNGPNYLNLKSFEDNFVQVLDKCYSKGEAPRAHFVLVDAMTFWGGSQFINSPHTGDYENFIVKEIRSEVIRHFETSTDPSAWCVTGASSGGYGALHLGSKFPQFFSWVAAVAPDSAFDLSLLPEMYAAIPAIKKYGGGAGVRQALMDGELKKRRDWHTVLNVIGMASCYSQGITKKKYNYALPLDLETAEVDKVQWKKWMAYDPVIFLEKRKKKLSDLSGVFLEVGNRDQFNLQYGARRIKKVLQKNKVPLKYGEFSGTHWDNSTRRPEIWKWLKKNLP